MMEFNENIKKYGNWSKVEKVRMGGGTRGDHDVYIINPDGQKLRSTRELVKYLIDHRHHLSNIDPSKVNFEQENAKALTNPKRTKVARSTKELKIFVESGGTKLPSFMVRKRKASTVKVQEEAEPLNCLSIFKCQNGNCGNMVTKQQMEIYEVREKICASCYQPKDPYQILRNFYQIREILPLTHEVNLLHEVSKLEKAVINDWFSRTFKNEQYHKEPDEKAFKVENEEEEDYVPSDNLVDEGEGDAGNEFQIVSAESVDPGPNPQHVPEALIIPKIEPVDEVDIVESETEHPILQKDVELNEVVHVKQEPLQSPDHIQSQDNELEIQSETTASTLPMPINIKTEMCAVYHRDEENGTNIPVKQEVHSESESAPEQESELRISGVTSVASKSTTNKIPNWADRIVQSETIDDEEVDELPDFDD